MFNSIQTCFSEKTLFDSATCIGAGLKESILNSRWEIRAIVTAGVAVGVARAVSRCLFNRNPPPLPRPIPRYVPPPYVSPPSPAGLLTLRASFPAKTSTDPFGKIAKRPILLNIFFRLLPKQLRNLACVSTTCYNTVKGIYPEIERTVYFPTHLRAGLPEAIRHAKSSPESEYFIKTVFTKVLVRIDPRVALQYALNFSMVTFLDDFGDIPLKQMNEYDFSQKPNLFSIFKKTRLTFEAIKKVDPKKETRFSGRAMVRMPLDYLGNLRNENGTQITRFGFTELRKMMASLDRLIASIDPDQIPRDSPLAAIKNRDFSQLPPVFQNSQGGILIHFVAKYLEGKVSNHPIEANLFFQVVIRALDPQNPLPPLDEVKRILQQSFPGNNDEIRNMLLGVYIILFHGDSTEAMNSLHELNCNRLGTLIGFLDAFGHHDHAERLYMRALEKDKFGEAEFLPDRFFNMRMPEIWLNMADWTKSLENADNLRELQSKWLSLFVSYCQVKRGTPELVKLADRWMEPSPPSSGGGSAASSRGNPFEKTHPLYLKMIYLLEYLPDTFWRDSVRVRKLLKLTESTSEPSAMLSTAIRLRALFATTHPDDREHLRDFVREHFEPIPLKTTQSGGGSAAGLAS